MKLKTHFAVVVLTVLVSSLSGQATKKTDSEIRQILIKESIAKYSGSCPCPESLDCARKKCGARSAYSKAGGKSVLCYESDVTQEMVDKFREKQR